MLDLVAVRERRISDVIATPADEEIGVTMSELDSARCFRSKLGLFKA